MKHPFVVSILAAVLAVPALALPDSFAEHVATIQAVGPEGKGNAAAAKAWQEITKADGEAIVPLLQAMEESGPISQNWLRSAVDVIVERELAAGKELPLAGIGGFLLDIRQDPYARNLAFELVKASDPQAASKLVPGMLNDPAVELRRNAVASLMINGQAMRKKEQPSTASLIYQQALTAARDVDQIQEITKQLRELGQEVDLPEHFGFLMHWTMVAPFENTDRKGFETVFPPEEKIDLKAKYQGKGGVEIAWREVATSDEYGKVDFNAPFSPMKEVTGYAYTEFDAAEARPAQLRMGCKNGWKIWLNGEFIFGRDEYHRGARIDQYIMPVQLKEGKNTLLVKCCQSKEDERWTREWEFQLRICDETGTAILATDRKPTPVPDEQPKGRRGGAK